MESVACAADYCGRVPEVDCCMLWPSATFMERSFRVMGRRTSDVSIERTMFRLALDFDLWELGDAGLLVSCFQVVLVGAVEWI
jgi:hypothetical protein